MWWPVQPGLPSVNSCGIRATDHKRGHGNLGSPQGSQEIRTIPQDVEVGELPRASLEELRILRKEIQKPEIPQSGQTPLQSLKLKGFFVGTGLSPRPWAAFPPPSSHSGVPPERQRWEEGCRGDSRTQPGPQDSPQPSSPWQRCYFYPVVHDAQSSDFLCSREARRASALILQHSTFSQRPEKEKE